MLDGSSTIESGLSRLRSICQDKKLEEFDSSINEDFKPVIDRQKNRSVSDSRIVHMTSTLHKEHLSEKNVFTLLVLPFPILVIKIQPHHVLMLPEATSDENMGECALSSSPRSASRSKNKNTLVIDHYNVFLENSQCQGIGRVTERLFML